MKIYCGKFDCIKEVEVERYTKDFVVLKNGRREAKCSNWKIYGETKEDVKAIMVKKALNEVHQAEANLLYYKERLRMIELL